MYERFTDRARKVMQLANYEAMRFNHEHIGTEHILLGLVREGTGTAAKVLKNLGVKLMNVRVEVEKLVQSGPEMVLMGKLPQTPRAKKVIEYSMEEARNLNHNYVGTEHMLLGLLREEEGVANQILTNLGLKLKFVRDEAVRCLGDVPENFLINPPSTPPSTAGEETMSENNASENPDRHLQTLINSLHDKFLENLDSEINLHTPNEVRTAVVELLLKEPLFVQQRRAFLQKLVKSAKEHCTFQGVKVSADIIRRAAKNEASKLNDDTVRVHHLFLALCHPSVGGQAVDYLAHGFCSPDDLYPKARQYAEKNLLGPKSPTVDHVAPELTDICLDMAIAAGSGQETWDTADLLRLILENLDQGTRDLLRFLGFDQTKIDALIKKLTTRRQKNAS